MAQRISENSGTSMNADSTPTPATPTKMPDERRHDRQPHRDHRPERDEQDDDRHADADELAARVLLGQQGECAGELDLHAVGAGARR